MAIGCLLLTAAVLPAQTHSVARVWNETCLDAIRIDFPHPPVHARNLFHLSVALYDAWAVYSTNAVGYLVHEKQSWGNITEAREAAMSYAAFTVLTSRYSRSVSAATTISNLNNVMLGLGYSPTFSTSSGTHPAAVGNRVGEQVLQYAIDDGTFELADYEDNSYTPTNDPLILSFPGTTITWPNHWQPLAFEFALTQNGFEADKIQSFLGPQWWLVRPFALARTNVGGVYHDPGMPPQVGGEGDAQFKSNNQEVIYYSSLLGPEVGNTMDISPGGPGKNNLPGTHSGSGHPTNPVTGLPYASNVVNVADYGRVIAEFWADGPTSETPPGHWNTLANEVADHPALERRYQGVGPELDPLEWDTKLYFILNGALHDAATAAWTCKRVYDYVRPISSIRWLAGNGQCSDPGQPSYHTNGIFLVPDLVEVVTTNTAAPGQKHEHLSGSVGAIAINAWAGEPEDPTNYGGRAWILASTWMPYQRSTFVTPAFPGYVSGHSTFSRAAAEVMTLFTGDEFFPGGMLTYTAEQGSLLFEYGPSEDTVLQWGTYYDAADEAGISRLYGGIHVSADDLPGRIMGAQTGIDAFNLGSRYFDGSILDETGSVSITRSDDIMTVTWDQHPGLHYRVEMSTNLLSGFTWTNAHAQAKDRSASHVITNYNGPFIFRVNRIPQY